MEAQRTALPSQAPLDPAHQFADVHRSEDDCLKSAPLECPLHMQSAAGDDPDGNMVRPARELIDLGIRVVTGGKIRDEKRGQVGLSFEAFEGVAGCLMSFNLKALL